MAERRTSKRFEEGMATRRQVLGDAHVDRAAVTSTDFDRPFQETHNGGGMGTRPVASGMDQARAIHRDDCPGTRRGNGDACPRDPEQSGDTR